MQCKNCNTEFTDSYCPNCGQSATVRRFEWHHIVNQVIETIGYDRGLFHTLYLLVVRPGISIRNYVEGKRIGFASPLKLVLIVGAFTNYLTFTYDSFAAVNPEDALNISLPFAQEYFKYSMKYFSFFSLNGALLFTFFSWIFFKKLSYNIIEHFIFNLYVVAGQFLLMIAFVPIIYHSNDSMISIWIYGIFNFIYNLWALVTFAGYSRAGLIKAIFAVGIPSYIAPYFGYVVFYFSPKGLWTVLDNVLG